MNFSRKLYLNPWNFNGSKSPTIIESYFSNGWNCQYLRSTPHPGCQSSADHHLSNKGFQARSSFATGILGGWPRSNVYTHLKTGETSDLMFTPKVLGSKMDAMSNEYLVYFYSWFGKLTRNYCRSSLLAVTGGAKHTILPKVRIYTYFLGVCSYQFVLGPYLQVFFLSITVVAQLGCSSYLGFWHVSVSLLGEVWYCQVGKPPKNPDPSLE